VEKLRKRVLKIVQLNFGRKKKMDLIELRRNQEIPGRRGNRETKISSPLKEGE